MEKTNLKLISFGIGLLVLLNLSFVAGCDEAEMQTMMTGASMTGNVVNNISGLGNSLEILSLIREILVIVVLILLVIYLIKLIRRKNK